MDLIEETIDATLAWIRVIIAGDRLPTIRRTFVCATVKRFPQVTAEV
jgi:hypothetical protein